MKVFFNGLLFLGIFYSFTLEAQEVSRTSIVFDELANKYEMFSTEYCYYTNLAYSVKQIEENKRVNFNDTQEQKEVANRIFDKVELEYVIAFFKNLSEKLNIKIPWNITVVFEVVFKAHELGDGSLGHPNIQVPDIKLFKRMSSEEQEASLSELMFTCGGLYQQLVDDYPSLNEKVLNKVGKY